MKQVFFTIIVAALVFLFVDAFPQSTQQKRMAPNQQMQMMAMMKDSSMVSMMMDSIASSSRLRMMMMQKMMQHARTDSAGNLQMSRMVTDGQEIRGTLTKSLDQQKLVARSMNREILIKFNPGVQQAQVSALESEVGLQQIKTIPALDVRVYKITSSKSVEEVVAISEKKPFVKYAEPNHQYKALKN